MSPRAPKKAKTAEAPAGAPTAPAALAPVSVVRVRPALMTALAGEPRRRIPLPRGARAVARGERLLLIGWAGGQTGRADLVQVLSVDSGAGTAEIFRSWGWSQGKLDTDLAFLGFQAGSEAEFEILGDAGGRTEEVAA